MSSSNDLPRLAVVAAIVAPGGGCGQIARAARLGDRLCGPVSRRTATATERTLAQALKGGEERPDDQFIHPAIAELLLLADKEPDADRLASGLSQAFVLPDDSTPTIARKERESAFAALYRKLMLHQLNSQVRNKAAALLGQLCGSDHTKRVLESGP